MTKNPGKHTPPPPPTNLNKIQKTCNFFCIKHSLNVVTNFSPNSSLKLSQNLVIQQIFPKLVTKNSDSPKFNTKVARNITRLSEQPYSSPSSSPNAFGTLYVGRANLGKFCPKEKVFFFLGGHPWCYSAGVPSSNQSWCCSSVLLQPSSTLPSRWLYFPFFHFLFY